MNIDELLGRHVALLLMGTDAAGEDDWAVFRGTLLQVEGRILFRHLDATLELNDDWVSRIAPASPEVAAILRGAEHVLALTVGNLSDEEAALLQRTGLKWPT